MTTPLAVSEYKAAQLMGVKRELFRQLVQKGIFPAPQSWDGQKRWSVDQLRAVANGDGAQGDEIKW